LGQNFMIVPIRGTRYVLKCDLQSHDTVVSRIGAGHIKMSFDKVSNRIFTFPVTTRVRVPFYIQCLKDICAESQVSLLHHQISFTCLSCTFQICFIDHITKGKNIDVVIPSRLCGPLNFHIFYKRNTEGLVLVHVAFHGTIVLLL